MYITRKNLPEGKRIICRRFHLAGGKWHLDRNKQIDRDNEISYAGVMKVN